MTKLGRASHLLAGLAGGLLAVIAGVVLITAGVIDTGADDGGQAPLSAQPITQPAASDDEGGGDGGRGLTVHEIYERTSPGVVFVRSERGGSASPLQLPQEGDKLPAPPGEASGSGFVLDREGFILTNAHIVEGSEDVSVTFGNDEQVDAEVVGADLSSDLAVLKVDPEEVELEPLELGDSNEVQVGNPVVAIGNPFGFDRTVTTGIVSAIQRNITAPNGFSIDDVVQTDASINPGNSGGPLLDARGRVIGINSQIATGGARGSVGIGFAVPVDTARQIIPQLQEDGEVERAFLGVTTTDVNETVADEANLSTEEGALVVDVTRNGPADEGGIEPAEASAASGEIDGGDVLVSVDGTEVTESADVAAAIADNGPGDVIDVEVLRGEQRETLEVELGERPASAGTDAPRPGGGGGGLPSPLP